ncbi:HD-GYP domain-containing protein [Peribacillus frigoritolerans]|uniref:HD-GYP domain-containing protein n=1 Tax=Peribacillus frigoritolerans TaxID=450367 RepID=UPI0021A9E24E|nr:HD-GYP domain-containing protein [Peribacillus frigoritolerans]MCT4479944.1 HD-GYP domain-containing protein [Peribacillus frigoritolerans]
MKNRRGKLINKANPPLTIPEIDFKMEELKKGESTLTEDHVQTKVKIHERINKASIQIKNIFQDIRNEGKIQLENVEEIKAEVAPVIAQAAKNPDVYYLFEELQANNEYTYKHNIGVGIIATYLGMKLGLSKENLSALTLAATLHDVGKTRIPDSILEKPGKLTAAEYEEMKRHAIYGYELLKSIPGIPPSIALTALQHHEREDGKGYPHGLMGNDIHHHSKIVAIADVFHAMSSNRVYHQAMPFYKVIEQMNSDKFGKFNPEILLEFVNRLMSTLVGKEVTLTNGRNGTIIMINPYDPLKVLLKTGSGIMDLRMEKEWQIERIIG